MLNNKILQGFNNPVINLIGAAPEMYDVLKKWVDWYDRNDAAENIEEMLIYKAKRALLKAEGKLE